MILLALVSLGLFLGGVFLGVVTLTSSGLEDGWFFAGVLSVAYGPVLFAFLYVFGRALNWAYARATRKRLPGHAVLPFLAPLPFGATMLLTWFIHRPDPFEVLNLYKPPSALVLESRYSTGPRGDIFDILYTMDPADYPALARTYRLQGVEEPTLDPWKGIGAHERLSQKLPGHHDVTSDTFREFGRRHRQEIAVNGAHTLVYVHGTD
jgi:hypothetical protein